MLGSAPLDSELVAFWITEVRVRRVNVYPESESDRWGEGITVVPGNDLLLPRVLCHMFAQYKTDKKLV